MRNSTGRTRPSGRASYMERPRVRQEAVPYRVYPPVQPDPSAGLHTCPVCGGGVAVMPWKYARSVVWAETSAERVPRLYAHHPGGARKSTGGIAERCAGSHQIPLD